MADTVIYIQIVKIYYRQEHWNLYEEASIRYFKENASQQISNNDFWCIAISILLLYLHLLILKDLLMHSLYQNLT